MNSLSRVRLLVTPWTAAYQAPPSMGFSRQGYWSGLPLPSLGIPVELFQILKDDAVKVLHSICQQIWKTQQWPQDWKRSVFVPIPKKGNAKEWSNYHTIALISHANKVMLKILEKSEEPEIKLPTFAGLSKKQESSRKTSISALLIILKPWLCGSHQTVENFWRDGNTRPPYLTPENSVCRSRNYS